MAKLNDKNDELVGLSGPFTKVPSGKFKGADPILKTVAPYWIVRIVGSYPYSVLSDVRFGSEKSAKEFMETFTERPYPAKQSRQNA